MIQKKEQIKVVLEYVEDRFTNNGRFAIFITRQNFIIFKSEFIDIKFDMPNFESHNEMIPHELKELIRDLNKLITNEKA